MPLFHNITGYEQEVGVNSTQAPTSASSCNIRDFDKRISEFKNKVLRDYERYNSDVNKSIADIAKNYHLNNEQIQRIIEEVNTQIYLIAYNKTRDAEDRSVEFDIADITKIKDLLGKNDIANTTSPADENDKNGENNITKKASLEEEDYFKYLPKTSGLGINTMYNDKFFEDKKHREKLASIKEKEDSALAELSSAAELLSNSIIKYAALNYDPQDIFKKVCNDSNMMKHTQILVKEAVNKNLGLMKQAKKIQPSVKFELNLVDNDEYDEFNLGKYSLNKTASEDLPTIEINRQTIKGLKQLVSLADKISENENKYIQATDEMKTYNKLLQDVDK